MAVTWALLRSELRARRRTAVAFLLLTVAGSATVICTLAAAGRAETSFDRFRDAVDDGHVFVGVENAPERLSEARELDGIESFAPFGYVPLLPVNASEEARNEGGGFASVDGTWLYEMQRPRVLDGRMPPAESPSSMAVNEAFARSFDVEPGAHITMRAEGPDGLVATVDMLVSAVVRTPLDVGANAEGPLVYIGPGVLAAHPHLYVAPGYAMVRLTEGEAGVEPFIASATELLGDEPSFMAASIRDQGQVTEDALLVQTNALRIVAAVAAFSGLILLSQVAARSALGAASADHGLRGIGASRPQRGLAAAAPALVGGSVGMVFGAAAAAAVSPLLPRGLARRAEPDPGAYVDIKVTAIVLAAGLSAMVLVLVAIAMRMLADRPVGPPKEARRTLAGVVHWLPARPTVTAGLRRIVSPVGTLTRGTTFAALVVGTAGAIATTTFGWRVDDVIRETGEWGAPFDFFVEGGDLPPVERIAAIEGVERVTVVDQVESIWVGGSGVVAFGLRAVEGGPTLTVIDGRPPRRANEVALGADTRRRLGVRVGESVPVRADAGGSGRRLTVVGTALFPIFAEESYADGIALTADGLSGLGVQPADTRYWVDVAPGHDGPEVERDIRGVGGDTGPISRPSEQLNLGSAARYPSLVGAIFVIVALVALSNAVVARAPERDRDTAVLRALGFTRVQLHLSVLWQTGAVMVLTLGMAVPFALASYELVWRRFAHGLFLDPGAEIGPAAVGGLALLALMAAATLSVALGHAVVRRSGPADLRTE